DLAYDVRRLDASLLTIPLYGFLPPDDPRVRGTLEAVRRELLVDGFVQRYRHDAKVQHIDGLPPGEGAFFLCSFWFVDNLILLGELDEAEQMFERLLSLRNELGLLSEEYEPALQRLIGNFPQAFSHIGLVNTALRLDAALAAAGR
ncbi:MAG: glycoside hydrolase family 15 protein, partial [Thermoleophilia bacterium]|nr:glycoside hydrolase family 15 protein [Thermoleophilia bacterium]